jgi:hypothetical protein
LYLLLFNLQSEEDDYLAPESFLRKISQEASISFNSDYERADILHTGGARLVKVFPGKNGMRKVGSGKMKGDGEKIATKETS